MVYSFALVYARVRCESNTNQRETMTATSGARVIAAQYHSRDLYVEGSPDIAQAHARSRDESGCEVYVRNDKALHQSLSFQGTSLPNCVRLTNIHNQSDKDAFEMPNSNQMM
jgi:hypothetical protein